MQNLENILVPIDFGEVGSVALEYACRLALQSKARLHFLHVVQRSLVSGTAESLEDSLRSFYEQLDGLLTPRMEIDLQTSKKVSVGLPHREIAKYAQGQQIDLIVIGTHGRTGLAHLALGSVAEQVLRWAPCPVLVIPTNGDRKEALPNGTDRDAEPTRRESSPALELIHRARSLRATDVHIDPIESGEYSVRLRIDGRLEDYCRMQQSVVEHLTNQIKMLAQLDIAEPFSPKEGRLRLPPQMADLEVRVTTAPVEGGEAVAMRLFSRDNVFFNLSELGFSERSLADVRLMLSHSEGLVLVTGPTGAGKTTSVYSMLESLGSVGCNIVSLEDPVEFAAPFVRQLSVDERHGITMTKGLTTVLRMDPDIIFLGEIRNATAAEITMRAASSGRFVFSTLHTRDVASTVTALRDLAISDRSLSANLTGIVNQRLLRKLCTQCKQQVEVNTAQQHVFAEHGLPAPATMYKPVGCNACRGTGYHGRVGVFETAVVSLEVAEAIALGQSESRLKEAFRAVGVATLETDSLGKVIAGVTDWNEAQSAKWIA